MESQKGLISRSNWDMSSCGYRDSLNLRIYSQCFIRSFCCSVSSFRFMQLSQGVYLRMCLYIRYCEFIQLQILLMTTSNQIYQKQTERGGQTIFSQYYTLIRIDWLYYRINNAVKQYKIIFDFDKLNKMADYGYDKNRFPNLTGDMFDCPICTNVVKSPKECTGCGDLFCEKCINDWMKKNNSCPKRCNGAIQYMTSKALIKIYNDLDIKCESCSKATKISDLAKHEFNCKRPKCWNHDICTNYQEERKVFGNGVCSEQCQLLDGIMKTGGNMKKMYQILSKYAPKNEPVKNVNDPFPPLIPSPKTGGGLLWDQKNCGLGLQFQNQGALVILKQPAYVFRTAIATGGFNSGLHYWEIIPDSRTENELKVGVTTSTGFDLNTAFCDHAFGFAYYGLGQLRYNSNASGPQYGKRMKKEGVLGVFLNMDKGQLSFSLNGENMGVAFDNVILKKGPVYPAVALLHCAGCSIRGELPIPACFK